MADNKPDRSSVPGNLTGTEFAYYSPRQVARRFQMPGLMTRSYPKMAPSSLEGLTRINGSLVASATTLAMRRDKALMFDPEVLELYDRYAKTYSGMDPRSWVPLAEARIDPEDEAAKFAYLGDRYAQFQEGRLGGVRSPVTAPVTVAQRQAAGDLPETPDPMATASGIASNPVEAAVGTPGIDDENVAAPGELSAPDQVAQQAETEYSKALSTPLTGAGPLSQITAPLASLTSGAGELISNVKGPLETATRTALTAGLAPFELIQGLARTGFGDDDRMFELADKYGLSDEERKAAFQTPQPTARGVVPRIGKASTDLAGFPEDRREVMLKARAEYQEQLETLPGVFEQTLLGQVVKDPGLLFDSAKGGSGFLPGQELQGKVDEATGKVFDIRSEGEVERDEKLAGEIESRARQEAAMLDKDPTYQYAYQLINGAPTDKVTLEQARRYVEGTNNVKAAILSQAADQVAEVAAPKGWTLGRGAMATWMDTDTLEFQISSGVVDFFNNLILDPMNAIPVAKGGSIAKLIPGTFEHAVKPGADMVLLRVPNDNFAGRAASFAGGEARDPVSLANVRSANRTIYNAPGIKYGDNGRVVTPHTLVAVPENTVKFLTEEARGLRTVAELVSITSPAEIMRRSNHKFPVEMARMLADADNPDAVIAAFATHSTEFLNSGLGRIGSRGSVFLMRPRNYEDYAQGKQANWLTGGTYNDSAVRRMFRETPRPTTIHWADKDTGYRQAYKWANGIGVKWEDLAPHLDNILGATNRAEAFAAYEGLMKEAANHLASKAGMSEGEAKIFTRLFTRMNEDMTRPTFTTDLVPEALKGVGGDRVMLMNEMLNSTLMLPDYRAARQVAGMIGAFRAKIPGLNRSGLKLDAAGNPVMSKGMQARAEKQWTTYLEDAMNMATSYWKYSTLIRGAYLIRNPFEMSIAAGLAGGRGLMTHPFGFMAGAFVSVLAKESTTGAARMMRALVAGNADAATPTGQGWLDVLGIPSRTAQQLVDQVGWSAALHTLGRSLDVNQMRLTGGPMWAKMEANPDDIPDLLLQGVSAFHGNLGLIDEPLNKALTQYVTSASRNSPEQMDDYVKAYIDHLLSGSKDPTIRDLLDPTMTTRQIYKKFRETNKDIRTTMLPDLLDPDDLVKDREFLQNLAKIAQKWHQDDPVLMEAMQSGRFKVVKADGTIEYEPIEESEGLVRYLRAKLEQDEAFRNNTPESLRYVNTTEPNLRAKLEAGAASFFEFSADIDDLVRIPVLRDAYVDRVKELIPYVKEGEIPRLEKVLRAQGDKRLADILAKAKPQVGGTLTAEHIHMSASGAATKEAERVFYNAHRRQNWALALRVIAPFAQSMANTWKRWGLFSMQNPQMAYRTLKPLYALTQPGSGAIYGAVGALTGDKSMEAYWSPDRPDLSVDGFFYTNRYGQREFVYPGLGALAALLPFVDPPDGTQFTSSMQGLNVAGDSIAPGFGPAVTFPASFVLEGAQYRDDPEGAILRGLIPYGLPEGSPLDKFIQAWMPTAIRKFLSATDPETNMTMTAQTVGTLISTGKYDLSSDAGRDELMHDAQEIALRMGTFSAIAGSVTPSTIRPAVSVMMKSGVDPRPFITQVQLAQEFRKYVDNSRSYNEGVQNFITDYGDTALFSVLPSRDTSGIQATNDVWTWRSNFEDSYAANQRIVGLFFAGDDFGDDFNQDLYNWQKLEGEIKPRDMERLVQDSQNRIADLAWNAYTTSVASEEGFSAVQQKAALAEAKEELMRKYPGWDPARPRFSANDTVLSRLTTLEKAVLSPEPDEGLVQTPGWPYLKAYMEERTKVIDLARTRGTPGGLGTKANRDLAEHLADVGVAMMRRDPSRAFTNAWNQLLSRELGATDTPEVPNG